ncbi:uncharacterized protein LOC108937594 [Arapaima gigas]
MEENTADKDLSQECPVCKDVMREPVKIAACKHTFCRSCLMRSLEDRPHCPLCRGNVSGDIRPTAAYNPGGAAQQVRRRRPAVNTEMVTFLSGDPVPHRFPEPYRAHWFQANAPPPAIEQTLPWHQAVAGAQGGPPVVAPRSVFSQPPIPPSSADPREENLSEILEVMQFLGNSSQSSQNSSAMVFSCPYCQEGGLDELDLVDHCNSHHPYDPTPVVCPVCAALPYGDPSYCSRDFIGHLNLRHCFYKQDFMDVHQGDAMNEQAVLWESFKKAA